MAISGACSSAVSRWKKQYLAELNGKTPELGKALTPEQQKKTTTSKIKKPKKDEFFDFFIIQRSHYIKNYRLNKST